MEMETVEVTIRILKNRKPFQPFTLVMVDGDRHEVDHIDGVIFREGKGVIIGPAGVLVIFDHRSVSQIVDDLANAQAA